MKKNLLFLLCILTSSITYTSIAQSIETQFTEVIDGSNNYKEYKVISKQKIAVLRRNILDSVSVLEQNIETNRETIAQQTDTISSLSNQLASVKTDLNVSLEKEKGIEVFGILTKKSTYNMVMWGTIILLVLIILFLYYKFSSSQSITKSTLVRLSEIEEEFEKHRQNALEREQQVRRKLQDEINKNR